MRKDTSGSRVFERSTADSWGVSVLVSSEVLDQLYLELFPFFQYPIPGLIDQLSPTAEAKLKQEDVSVT
jgi:hypothetical protein